MVICPGCGNDIPIDKECPICASGRSQVKLPRMQRRSTRHKCPQCREPLLKQNWEGTVTYLCETCRGVFFPGGNLENVLDKLRASGGTGELKLLMEDRSRRDRATPSPGRNRPCAACGYPMQMHRYADQNLLIQVCPQHGTWVDEVSLMDLLEYVSMWGKLTPRTVRRAIDPPKERET